MGKNKQKTWWLVLPFFEQQNCVFAVCFVLNQQAKCPIKQVSEHSGCWKEAFLQDDL